MFLLWLLLIVVVIILCVVIFRYRHLRVDTLNGLSGQVGGGKTSSCICRAICKVLRPIYFLGRNRRKYKNDYIVISSFPVGKLEKKKGKITGKRFVRVWFKKIYCYDLDLDILILKKRLPQNEVILITDEFSGVVSQLDFALPIVKDNLKEFCRCFRHYTEGKGYWFWTDQCSKEIVNVLRRRTAYCYNMISCKKIKFLPIMIYEYRKLLISDEIENVNDTSTNTEETDIKKTIFFINPFKYYDSCYLSERYKAITQFMSLNTSLTLKRNDLLKLNSDYCYYETLKYDNIDKESYELQFKKKK